MTIKIFSLTQAAKALGRTRWWLKELIKQGRLKYELEDQAGRPYFYQPPSVKIERLKPGPKPGMKKSGKRNDTLRKKKKV